MEGEKEENAQVKEVADLIGGVKIIIPFAMCIISLAGVWYDSRNQAEMMQKDITIGVESRAKNEARIQALTDRMNAQDLVLTEVKGDLKHIKDDTQATLTLVREWMRTH
jgi:hypothetical protein